MRKKMQVAQFNKYIEMAKSLKASDALIISPRDICFDIRAILKCRWGCEDYSPDNMRCGVRDTTYNERVKMIKSYKHILLVHSHDPRNLSATVLEIERKAFFDGYYFAFAIRFCNLCKTCSVKMGN